MVLGGRSRSHHQRTFLRADEEPEPSLVNGFRASVSLARSLSLERKSQANGQVAYLRKKEQQLAYVTSARCRKLPPLESVVNQQTLLGELRRDCTDLVLPSIEEAPGQVRRLGRQEAFLASRKARHDAATEAFEREVDELSEERESRVTHAMARMRKSVEDADSKVDTVLYELEVDTEHLGMKTEDDIKDMARELVNVGDWRREQIDGFCSELEGVDRSCSEECARMLKAMVTELTAAAHVMPGEVERIVEEKALKHNAVHLENQKAVKTLGAKLHVQALEKTKSGKMRHHKGVLLWKQKRHRHSIEAARERIASNEFKQPPALEQLMEQVREQQRGAFSQRMELCVEFFRSRLSKINTNCAKTWEERNASLNESIAEALDDTLKELKEFKDALDLSAEDLLKALSRDLEILDAREEWGSHETVTDLVDAEVRPSLQECLDLVQKCLLDVSEELTRQDEAQHHVVSSFVHFFKEIGRKQEQMQKSMDDFETSYKHEVEDCEDADEERINEHEGTLNKRHEEINEEVHHDALDKLKEVTFEHLDVMEQGYRDHAEALLAIHQRYPSDVAAWAQKQTQTFCESLGLVTEEKLEEEATVNEEATGTGSEEPTDKKPSKKTPAPAEPEAAEEEAEEAPEAEPWPLAEGSGVGVVVLQTHPPPEFRKMVLAARPPADGEAPERQATQLAEGDGEEEAKEEGPKIPQLADGTEALELLEFQDPWMEDQLVSARATVFLQLGMIRQHLDRHDTPAICKEVRVELDQRLRKHTNRKGEVQVEWYMPRYNQISKHKDKFDRFLIDAAKRNQAHDERTVALCEEMQAAEEQYVEKVAALKAKVPEAEAMAFVTAIERQAREAGDALAEMGSNVSAELMVLATEAPQKLQKESQALLNACKSGAEGYSEKEIDFYGSELEELAAALEKRAADRSEKAGAITSELDAKRAGPYDEFRAVYDEAVKALKEARKRAKEAKAAEEAAAAGEPAKKGK